LINKLLARGKEAKKKRDERMKEEYDPAIYRVIYFFSIWNNITSITYHFFN